MSSIPTSSLCPLIDTSFVKPFASNIGNDQSFPPFHIVWVEPKRRGVTGLAASGQLMNGFWSIVATYNFYDVRNNIGQTSIKVFFKSLTEVLLSRL